MDVKVMSKKLTKEEIQQYIFAGNLNDLIYLVKKYNNPVYRREDVLSYLINLLFRLIWFTNKLHSELCGF